MITSPDGRDHSVDEFQFARTFNGRFLARCGTVVISGSMVDRPGKPCALCVPHHEVRPARRHEPAGPWVHNLRSLFRAPFAAGPARPITS
jgi:hypothetical protein